MRREPKLIANRRPHHAEVKRGDRDCDHDPDDSDARHFHGSLLVRPCPEYLEFRQTKARVP